MLNISDLNQLSVFEGVSEEHLKKILLHTQVKEFKNGEYLEKEGDRSEYFYVVKSGKIAFETKLIGETTVRLSTVGKDEFFGESSMIPPYQTSTSRHAIEDSVLYLFNGDKLRETCEKDHEFGYVLMNRIAQMMSVQLHRSREALMSCHFG